MKIKLVTKMVLVVALLMTVTGCSMFDKILTGEVTGEVGETYNTQWFEFNVKSITTVEEYAGYTPEEDYMLYDVVISETNTFDETIPFGTYDFYMEAESLSDPVYPLDPIDDDSNMMPKNFSLKEDESVEYHMVYEIPVDTAGLKLMYLEIDEEENEGVTFTINVN